MDSIILIIIIIIIFFLFINIEPIKNTFYFDNDANYQYNLDIIDSENCDTYNCKLDKNNVLVVGNDSNNNPVFKYKDNFYKLDDNNKLIEYNIEPSNIEYYNYSPKILTDISSMKIKFNYSLEKLGKEYKDFKYIGILNNNYYHQEYILYEKLYEAENKELENKLYYYVLIKIINEVYTIMYELPPRNKILPKEYIWASYGSFQIGPLIFD